MTGNGVIFVLLLLFLASLLYRVYSRNAAIKDSVKAASSENPTITKQKYPSKAGKGTKSLTIDLNGSYICKTASTSAYIKNKKARITNIKKTGTDNFIFDGDCIYMWKQGEKKGSSSCGYGQALSLVTMFGGTVDLQTVMPYIGSLQKSLGKNNTTSTSLPDVAAISKSCVERAIPEKTLFTPPENITFTESKKSE